MVVVRAVAVVAVAGCYAPGTPAGVVCDPAEPACPSGQVCVAEAGGFACRPPGGGGGDPDAPAPTRDGDPDANLLPYITAAPGWSVDVLQDFSAQFTYDADDWPEKTETFDNQPSWIFALHPPFPAGLGVLAGREVLVLTGGAYEAHDFGAHPPDTTGQADHLTGAMFVQNLDGDPALFVSSSSENGGDGSFTIDPTWNIARDINVNNVRGILFDPGGAFDNRGAPEGYLGAQQGIVRRSDGMTIIPGDNHTLRVIGSDLLVARKQVTGYELRRIATTTHAETLLSTHGLIRLGEGAAPPPHVAWAIVDQRRLALVRATGELDTVLETTDLGFRWHAVAIPPPSHPLAGRAFLLESNRALDLDRVLAITPP